MKFRFGLLALSFALALQAQMQMNVSQLADFVRSELALRQHTDKQIAAGLKKIQLSEKLTDKTITDLEAQGAGPKTAEALRRLRDESAGLKHLSADVTSSPATAPDNTLTKGPATATLSAAAPPAPPPNSVQQQQIIDLMRQYAMSYTDNLPNFVCVEVVHQAVDPNGGDRYQTIGNILSKVSYNEGRENYQVYSQNGQLVETSMERLRGGGAVSSGEFGSMMREIFDPASNAEISWEKWIGLRGRTMAVFNYFIDSGHSKYSISYSSGPGDEQRIITAYRGLIYADANTGEIDRIKFVAVDIPRSFPVSRATETLDYDLATINGQQYVVPLRALLLMQAPHQSARNELYFRNYRRFGTESTITYDASPLPDSKTEEQPATGSGLIPNGAKPSGTTAQPATPSKPAPAPPAKTQDSSPWTLPTAPPPPPTQ